MIFYFSGTGNSKYVAERIAAKFNDAAVPIEKHDGVVKLKDGEMLGIVTPVNWWELPVLTREFLQRLTLKSPADPYCFIVTTYGTTPGCTYQDAKKILAVNGINLQAGYSIKMPDNWTPIFDLSDSDQVARQNDEAEVYIAEVLKKISKRAVGNQMEKVKPMAVKILTDPFLNSERKTNNFYVEDSCIGCGLCARKCPVQAIEIRDKKPVWVKERCALCLRCLHSCPKTKISVSGLDLYYGENHALKNVSMDIKENAITAFIGPSGCGKSTFLKTLNRMNDLVDGVRITGKIMIDGEDIYGRDVDTTMLRKKVGMVFQQPNPFPMTIYDNIAYGPRVHGIKDKKTLDRLVEESLKGAAIWDEVKDRLHKSALGLSGGQQQRICIARALAVKPEILLMDEPTSALDPISTTKIEDLMEELKKKYTVVVVTHNMQQAVRVSDYTAFFLVGEMVEFGTTKHIFSYPQDKRTEDYITGRFG